MNGAPGNSGLPGLGAVTPLSQQMFTPPGLPGLMGPGFNAAAGLPLFQAQQTGPSGRKAPMERKSSAAPPRKQCNCKNSRCLKLYCECFASGRYCEGCNCLHCFNNRENEATRQSAVEAILERNPNAFRPKITAGAAVVAAGGRHLKGCNCKKSVCLKKYCECFQAGIYCSDICKCVDCKNYEGSDARSQVLAAQQDPSLAGAAALAMSNNLGTPGGGGGSGGNKRGRYSSSGSGPVAGMGAGGGPMTGMAAALGMGAGGLLPGMAGGLGGMNLQLPGFPPYPLGLGLMKVGALGPAGLAPPPGALLPGMAGAGAAAGVPGGLPGGLRSGTPGGVGTPAAGSGPMAGLGAGAGAAGAGAGAFPQGLNTALAAAAVTASTPGGVGLAALQSPPGVAPTGLSSIDEVVHGMVTRRLVEEMCRLLWLVADEEASGEAGGEQGPAEAAAARAPGAGACNGGGEAAAPGSAGSGGDVVMGAAPGSEPGAAPSMGLLGGSYGAKERAVLDEFLVIFNKVCAKAAGQQEKLAAAAAAAAAGGAAAAAAGGAAAGTPGGPSSSGPTAGGGGGALGQAHAGAAQVLFPGVEAAPAGALGAGLGAGLGAAALAQLPPELLMQQLTAGQLAAGQLAAGQLAPLGLPGMAQPQQLLPVISTGAPGVRPGAPAALGGQQQPQQVAEVGGAPVPVIPAPQRGGAHAAVGAPALGTGIPQQQAQQPPGGFPPFMHYGADASGHVQAEALGEQANDGAAAGGLLVQVVADGGNGCGDARMSDAVPQGQGS